MTMIKSELIQRLAETQRHLSESDVEMAVKSMLEHISLTLENGGRIEIRGFGTFTARKRKAAIARNPKTGEKVTVPVKYVPFFKSGKPLQESVNQ
jgi:integration host factor subunit beta